MSIYLPIWLWFAIPAGILVFGVYFGWDNGKKNVITIIEAEAKTLLGDAAKHVTDFWAKVKAKI